MAPIHLSKDSEPREDPAKKQAAENKPKPAGKIRSFISSWWTTMLGWLGFTGMIASSSTCPICGQAGCPVGVGQAAGLGLVAALILRVLTKTGLRKPRQTAHAHELHDHR